MKIAVSTMEKNLMTDVDPRFGRCQYFIIIDPKSKEFEAIQNESASAMGGAGGAGIQAAQFMANKKVDVVLTGNIGPNAFKILSTAGIIVITRVNGIVKDAIEKFKNGDLKETTEPNVLQHFGMNI